MALSGNQKAITPARSALLRSGAGRSGWPLTIGWKVPLYALSNVARSGATRSNYHSPSGFVTIGGIQVGTAPAAADQKIVGNIQITDVLNETPNRCTFRVRGTVPLVGQDVIVTVGSKNTLTRLFGGQVLNVSHAYLGSPALAVFDVNAIDYTWGLHQRIVSQRWITTSATTIAQQILAAGAPGYTGEYIAAGLPVLDEFTVTDQTVPAALTALAKRIGGYWHIDYFKRLHLYQDADPDMGTDPAILNPIHASLTNLVIDKDGSQLITRVFVEGGGSTTLALVMPGETLIPVVTASWYETGGGQVKSGPQRIRYGGLVAGGGGTLVGPGASPAAALTALAIGGTGVNPGRHEYAVSFVTASGESLTGPRTAVVVGVVAPPVAALIGGSILAGAGVDPGWHYWCVSFVTAAGETTPGPPLVYTVPAGLDVLAAPTANTPTFGGGIEPGSFQYAVTYGTSSGETTIGPPSNMVTLITASVAPIPPPPSPLSPTTGGGIENGTFQYQVTNETSAGESMPSPGTGLVTLSTVTVPNAGAPTILSNGPNSGQGDLTPMLAYAYACTYSTAATAADHTHETAVVAATPNTNALASTNPTPPGKSSTMTVSIPYSDQPEAKWVHVYRRNGNQVQNPSSFRLLSSHANVPGTGAFQIQDHTADSAIINNPAPPAANNATAANTAIPLTLPIGPAGVTRRHLYRSNGGPFQRVTTIGNNTTTAYTDVTPTASLSGQPTPPAGSTQNAVPLSNIPIGPTGTQKRYLYRSASGGVFRLVATFNNNTTTTYTDVTPTASLGATAPTVNTSAAARVTLNNIPIGGPDVTSRRIYRSKANTEAPLQLALTIADNATTSVIDNVTDAALGATAPPTNTALAARVQLSAVPIGTAAVTARKIYRTAAEQSALKLLTTLADNLTTSWTDAADDATLGASPPGSDTSGLTQPAGNVNAGSTTLIVAGASAFLASGGWAVIGNGQQVIRYSGVSGNSLIGIPPAGPGAITAAISYNSTVTQAPMLTGVPASGAGAVLYQVKPGDDVNLWIQVDDPDAQAAVAVLFGNTGIIEDVIQDRRLSATESRARGRAHLAARKDLQIRVRYRCRDLNTRSGRTVTVNLLAWPYQLSAAFTIQSVTIHDFTPSIYPTFDVEASSERFTFEDLLRRIGTRTDPTG